MEYKTHDTTTINGLDFKEWINQQSKDKEEVAVDLGVAIGSLRTYFAKQMLTFKTVRNILTAYPDFPVQKHSYTSLSGNEIKKWCIDNKKNTKPTLKILGITEKNIHNKINNTKITKLISKHPEFPQKKFEKYYTIYDFGFSMKFKINDSVKLFHFPDINTSTDEYNDELERYFKELMSITNKAESEIIIYDYLIIQKGTQN